MLKIPRFAKEYASHIIKSHSIAEKPGIENRVNKLFREYGRGMITVNEMMTELSNIDRNYNC